jgi:tellurite resistance protein
LTDGSHDWVLDSVGPFTPQIVARPTDESPRLATVVPATVGGAAPPRRLPTAEVSLAVLARVVAADGQIDPRERKALVALGARRNLSPDQVEAILNTAAAQEIELPVPGDSRQAGDYLKQMVEMSLADGNISAPEQKLLMHCARQMNLSPEDVRLEVARQRRERFQAARGAIRESKRGSA